MIKNPTTRIVAAVILVAGLAIAPLLDNSEWDDQSITPRAYPPPQFQIRWQRGELTLSGHTSSMQHEQDLLQAANTSYPERPVVTDFQPLGIVPPNWEDLTIQILHLLTESASAKAELSAGEIRIRGITVDDFGWQSRFNALKKTLPPSISVVAEILPVDPAISVAKICSRAFAALKPGAINFDESSTRFRSSAYPRLDRVIALANVCGKSDVLITGYTDSSGDATLNQRLSLRRANAVGDYFIRGGIDRSRIQVAGAGSSAPIADDNTRYGRSLNRRIEIRLTSTDRAAEHFGPE